MPHDKLLEVMMERLDRLEEHSREVSEKLTAHLSEDRLKWAALEEKLEAIQIDLKDVKEKTDAHHAWFNTSKVRASLFAKLFWGAVGALATTLAAHFGDAIAHFFKLR